MIKYASYFLITIYVLAVLAVMVLIIHLALAGTDNWGYIEKIFNYQFSILQ